MLALIIAAPGPLRDGLHAVLRTIPPLETIRLADTVSAALEMNDVDTPDLLLMDGSLFRQTALIVVTQITTRWPNTKRLILVDDIPHVTEVAEVGYALVKGSPATELFRAIEDLLVK